MKFDGEILSLRDRLMQHRRYLIVIPKLILRLHVQGII